MILPADAEVERYMRAKFEELREHFEYGSVSIHCSGFDRVNYVCQAYTNAAIGSKETDTLTEAIALIVDAKSNKTESELLRERAAEMMAKADELEGSKP